jgi:AhpD family alkylhydroperoxidase
MGHLHELDEELRPAARALRDAIPDVMRGFAELSRAAMAPGALAVKHKELIALAIAITRECDGCVAAHVRGARRAGATREEVAETAGVAIVMNGGPGTVWGPRALAMFDELATSDTPNA